MKLIFSSIALMLIITLGYGQNKHTAKADQLFENYQYVDAIKQYLELVSNKKADAYVHKQLGDSYFNVFNIEEAAKWYKLALKKKQGAETHYRYSQVLKSQGKYEEANEQMDMFSKMNPKDPRAKAHLENPNYIPQLADISKSFDVEETNINDKEQSDFGAVLSNDDVLYFTSSRKKSKKNSGTNQPYLDVYKSERNKDGSLSQPMEVEELNTPYHDGPIAISKDAKTMYFSRDGHSEGSYKRTKNNKVKLSQQGIYRATKIGGKWTNIKALPINSKDYTVTHPSISADGKTLYFASDMPGGIGDSDIWKISVSGKTYGKPVNLGPDVNTAGKEGFPYISEDNVLYFSSIGQQGFGGFDIYKSDLNKNGSAENLGKGINTEKDDFAFSINTSKKEGYFSSNRSGVDNIYKAIPICQFETLVVVKDANTNSVISGADVSILDDQNNEIAKQLTTSKGETNFNVSCEVNYTINIIKDGYQTDSYEVLVYDGNDVTVNADLKPINEMITETEVKLNTIYFEFNESNITQQGASELDKLVTIMQDYPEMKIRVRSHTDSKGAADYNLKLSERRAQATVQYVISKGINGERLAAEGVGSTEPKIDCGDGCTEEEDSQNRRSEFLIVKD